MTKILDAKTGAFVTYGGPVHIIDADTGEYVLVSGVVGDLQGLSSNLGIGTTSPDSKLDVNGGIKFGSDSDPASVDKAGTLRYVTSGTGSALQMCMQTGASTYGWVAIIQNTW